MTSIACTTGSLCSASFIGCGYSDGNAFLSNKDIQFINCLNSEIIKNVVGQNLSYYRVDEQKTEMNLYGESKVKTFRNPIKIFARIEVPEPIQTMGSFPLDEEDRLIVYFDKFDLYKHNIEPSIGDFVKAENEIVYEILKLYEWQPLFGALGNNVLVKAECINSRQTQIDSTLSQEEWELIK